MIPKFILATVLMLVVFACTAKDSTSDVGNNPMVTGIRIFQLNGAGFHNECGEEINSDNAGDLDCSWGDFSDDEYDECSAESEDDYEYEEEDFDDPFALCVSMSRGENGRKKLSLDQDCVNCIEQGYDADCASDIEP